MDPLIEEMDPLIEEMDPLIQEMDPLISEMNPLIPEVDPLRRAQIILLCDLCKTAHLQSHCERCDINLCKVCVGEHLSDSSIRHNVVPYKYRKSLNYSNCLDHSDEHCKKYCEKCEIPVCSTCVSSGKHENHDISDILEIFYPKTESLHKDLEELETRICPRFEEMASDGQREKAEIETNYEKLTTTTDQQGENLHREITAIVNQRKSDIQEMKAKHLSILDRNTVEITHKIAELKRFIADLKAILKSNDVSLTSTYKSRNSEFRTLLPKVQVTLPNYSPQKINKKQLNEMFGSLSSLSINTEHCGTIKSMKLESSSPFKPMESAETVSFPAVKPMESPEAVSSSTVKPIKSGKAVSSPVKPFGSPEGVSPSPVKPMGSPEAVSSPPIKLMKSPEAVSPPVKQMKSPEAVSFPPVKQMKSPEAVSSPPVKQMKSPEAVSSPPVKQMKSSEAVSTPPVKRMLDEPLFTTIYTGNGELYSVSCLSEGQVWIRGDSNVMRLVNIQGKLLTSIQSKSGNWPRDISVTRDKDLVYSDYHNRTVNILKNKQIHTMIILQGWRPLNVCSTFYGGLLVTMTSDDRKQSKVVRYSGSTETQTIQFDEQGRPLFISDYTLTTYISENRNLDICVAHCAASAVVVLNQSGKLRFRYTGHPSNTGESFDPVGITTDSQCHILIADCGNNRIHILDQDGQFLRYIHKVRAPCGLCVDTRDYLFVAERVTARLKKIQYVQWT